MFYYDTKCTRSYWCQIYIQTFEFSHSPFPYASFDILFHRTVNGCSRYNFSSSIKIKYYDLLFVVRNKREWQARGWVTMIMLPQHVQYQLRAITKLLLTEPKKTNPLMRVTSENFNKIYRIQHAIKDQTSWKYMGEWIISGVRFLLTFILHIQMHKNNLVHLCIISIIWRMEHSTKCKKECQCIGCMTRWHFPSSSLWGIQKRMWEKDKGKIHWDFFTFWLTIAWLSGYELKMPKWPTNTKETIFRCVKLSFLW